MKTKDMYFLLRKGKICKGWSTTDSEVFIIQLGLYHAMVSREDFEQMAQDFEEYSANSVNDLTMDASY